MSNKMTDYQKDLEAYAQKKLRDTYAKPPAKPFPLNKILITLIVLGTWGWFYGVETLEQAARFSPPALKDKLQTAANSLAAFRSPRLENATSVPDPTPTPTPEPIPNIKATQEAALAVSNETPQAPSTSPESADVPMVRIDGRWYPKSSDNIYLINGKRILYIDKMKDARMTSDKETK